MEKLEFKIQLSVSDLYYFMMYHYYTGMSGIFGTVLSIAAAIVLIVRFGTMSNTERLFFFIVAILFTVVNPVLMRVKAGAQIKSNKSLGGALTYSLDADQITISLGEEKAEIKWNQVVRVKDNGRELVVYVTNARGYIWPKKQIAAEYDSIVEILQSKIAAGRLRLKK